MNNFTLERNNYRRKLIMLVKQHPILWNKTQENYNRNRPQKIFAWHQISEQLGITVDKLRRTWENLRDQYRRDLKREVRFGFKSKWRFFNEMDFIRAMVCCKENELKENDFTDSDSELDVTENQTMQLQCSPVTTTLVAPTTYQTITTPCTSNLPSNITCASNILPFQPIMLSKQYQTIAEDVTQINNLMPTTSSESPKFSVPSRRNSVDILDLPTNCDSSKNCTKPSNASPAYETVTKEEPDFEEEQENACALAQESTPTKDNQIAREFQEACVSTSSQKRFRASIEEISDMPTASNSQSQIKCETNLNVKDDDYYFVMSLLPSLRQIPRNRKFPLRIGIMSLIAKDLEEVCKE